jgi:hypothetical protein
MKEIPGSDYFIFAGNSMGLVLGKLETDYRRVSSN